MKLLQKSRLVLIAALATCMCLTACGNSTEETTANASTSKGGGVIEEVSTATNGEQTSVNVLNYVSVTFNGTDGYGTATLDTSSYLSETLSELDFKGLGQDTYNVSNLLDKGVSFSISKTSGLSNGDTVVVTATVSASYFEGCDFIPAEGTLEITVSGLIEPIKLDPFDGFELYYSGYAPKASALISQSGVSGLNLVYTLDKSSNLSNGDTIKVTVSASDGTNVEDYCLNNGYILMRTSLEYEVSGLSRYVDNIADIPEEALLEMTTQAEDTLKAWCANNFESEYRFLESYEVTNVYLLNAKDLYLDDLSETNYLYFVYEVNVDVASYYISYRNYGSSAKETYYWFARFDNIIVDDDGNYNVDIYNITKPSNKITSAYTKHSINTQYYYGYFSVDDFVTNCITTKVEKYTFTSVDGLSSITSTASKSVNKDEVEEAEEVEENEEADE